MPSRIVVFLVGPNRSPVARVDPVTRRATDERQQFRVADDGVTVAILPRAEWIAQPEEYHVGYMSTR